MTPRIKITLSLAAGGLVVGAVALSINPTCNLTPPPAEPRPEPEAVDDTGEPADPDSTGAP